MADPKDRQCEAEVQTVNAEADTSQRKLEEKTEMNDLKQMMGKFQLDIDQLRSKVSALEESGDGSSKRREGLDGRYYECDGKKGYLLILDSMENRRGTHKDVEKLTQFFGNMLNFEVNNPRQASNEDLSRDEIHAVLENVRDKLDKHRYYCFICVILSHGSEEGIKAKGDFITPDDIRQSFDNTKTLKFRGRPKIFLIQACRGCGYQFALYTDADVLHETPEQHFEKSNLCVGQHVRTPTDADTLFAYATTPGYVAHRHRYEGSWFIEKCIEVFKDDHMVTHLEDMLITVRQKVACMTAEDNVTQMPCVWSTLTKRLMLKRFES